MEYKSTPRTNQGKVRTGILRVALLLTFMALFATAIFVFGDAFQPGHYEPGLGYGYVNEGPEAHYYYAGGFDEYYYINEYGYGGEYWYGPYAYEDCYYMGESCQSTRQDRQTLFL